MKNKLYLSLLIAILLCLAGWTAHAQLQRSSPARQAWEYKSLVYVVDASRTTLYEDAKMIPGTPVMRMPELGAQGWELISVAADNSNYTYWLKRAK